jgi:hypothetical protein
MSRQDNDSAAPRVFNFVMNGRERNLSDLAEEPAIAGLGKKISSTGKRLGFDKALSLTNMNQNLQSFISNSEISRLGR